MNVLAQMLVGAAMPFGIMTANWRICFRRINGEWINGEWAFTIGVMATLYHSASGCRSPLSK